LLAGNSGPGLVLGRSYDVVNRWPKKDEISGKDEEDDGLLALQIVRRYVHKSIQL